MLDVVNTCCYELDDQFAGVRTRRENATVVRRVVEFHKWAEGDFVAELLPVDVRDARRTSHVAGTSLVGHPVHHQGAVGARVVIPEPEVVSEFVRNGVVQQVELLLCRVLVRDIAIGQRKEAGVDEGVLRTDVGLVRRRVELSIGNDAPQRVLAAQNLHEYQAEREHGDVVDPVPLWCWRELRAGRVFILPVCGHEHREGVSRKKRTFAAGCLQPGVPEIHCPARCIWVVRTDLDHVPDNKVPRIAQEDPLIRRGARNDRPTTVRPATSIGRGLTCPHLGSPPSCWRNWSISLDPRSLTVPPCRNCPSRGGAVPTSEPTSEDGTVDPIVSGLAPPPSSCP